MLDFSVIIPAKNEEGNIIPCLNSIFATEYPKDRYEIIVIDNGSEDKTVELSVSIGVRIAQIPEVNISALRNYGAKLAQGKVLAFLDADCTVAVDWLQQAKRYAGQDDVVCFGSSPVIPDNPTWVEETWFLVRKSGLQVFEREWQESTNMFIPKKTFEKVGGFNEQLATCEDVDLSYRLLKFGKIISDNRIVAIHHRDPKTIKEFFLKERWRGKSNYAGLLQHGVQLRELPSLLLPLYFTGMLMISVALLITGHFFSQAALFFAGAQLPVVVLVWLKIRRNLSLSAYIRLLLLYNVYFMARSLAIFPSRK